MPARGSLNGYRKWDPGNGCASPSCPFMAMTKLIFWSVACCPASTMEKVYRGFISETCPQTAVVELIIWVHTEQDRLWKWYCGVFPPDFYYIMTVEEHSWGIDDFCAVCSVEKAWSRRISIRNLPSDARGWTYFAPGPKAFLLPQCTATDCHKLESHSQYLHCISL